MALHPLLRRLGLEHPIIQAPMAGGADTPALAAAVSAAGGLGSLGVAYLDAPGIAAATGAVHTRTNRAYAVNVFAPTPPAPPVPWEPVLARLAAYHAELGLPPPAEPAIPEPGAFDARFAAALASGAPVLSFTFGLLPPEAMAEARAAGRVLIGTATTVAEARALEDAGCDAVVAQGAEAGGHRGTFAGPFADAMIGTMALVPQMVRAVSIPVIASGGIMDGAGVAAALCLGAVAAQMGTAFLTTPEAGTSAAWRTRLAGAAESETRVTDAFSGRPARGIVNRFMAEMEGAPNLGFPLQNTATRALRQAAASRGEAAFLSLWAGQGLTLGRMVPAADLVALLARETDAALRGARAVTDQGAARAVTDEGGARGASEV